MYTTTISLYIKIYKLLLININNNMAINNDVWTLNSISFSFYVHLYASTVALFHISLFPGPLSGKSWEIHISTNTHTHTFHIFMFLSFLFSFRRIMWHGILRPNQGMKPVPPAVEVWSLTHWQPPQGLYIISVSLSTYMPGTTHCTNNGQSPA